MPRRPRIDFPDGVYHVTNRGVDRRNIVIDDHDRWNWQDRLAEAAQRFGWRVFAYALLNNHFHLFLRTPEPNLSDGMHDFQGAFAGDFNRRHSRTGHLFQGRFHAVIVEFEPHALVLSRYVHLNSVRAGLATIPDTFQWSSFPAYMNPARAPDWLDWQTVLSDFGGTASQARIAYRRFVMQGVQQPPDSPLKGTVDHLFLGSAAFIDRIQRLLSWEDDDLPDHKPRPRLTLSEILTRVGTTMSVSESDICCRGRQGNHAREIAILLCRELCDAPLEDVARLFGGVSRSAISDTVRRVRERCEADAAFRELVAQTRTAVIN